MGARYLTDLADVCRRAGLVVVEVDGWQTRARGSGGYDSGRPNHVMVHHTASGPSSDGWPDVNYCTYGDDDAPLCNLYLARDGTVYVCAGGATNTNGTGHDPCGAIPDDSMNSSAIGIEAGNDGTGERWPPAQCDAYVLLVDALCDAYAIPTGRVHAHAEWSPQRKYDPAGPDRWAAGASTWNMAEFRSDVADAGQPVPPPTPPPEDDVITAFAKCAGQSGTFACYSGGYKVWLQSSEVRDMARALASMSGIDDDIDEYDETTFRAFGPIIGPIPNGYDPWGVRT